MAWLIWNHPKPVEFHFHSNVTEVLLTDPAIGIGAAILPMRAAKKIVVLLVNIQMNQVCDREFTRKMSLLLCHSDKLIYNIIYYVETKILIFSSLVSNMMADGNHTTFLNIYFNCIDFIALVAIH